MNILQITNKFPYPPKDGASVCIWNMTESFAFAGHSVTVLALNTNKHHTDFSAETANLPNNIQIYPIDINTDRKAFALLFNLMFSKLPYTATRFYSKAFENKLIELLDANKYDVIQIELPYQAYYIPIIRKHSNALISLRLHNVENEIWKRLAINEKSKFRRDYIDDLAQRIENFEVNMLKEADCFIPVTKRDCDYFISLGIDKPHLVAPIGIQSRYVDSVKVSHTSLNYLFIGTLDWQPNVEGLLWFLDNVWKEVIKIQSDKQFYIIGRYAPEDLAETLKRYPNTTFLGAVDNAINYMKSYAVMVVPLQSGSGMRVKIIEGMAAGCAIISTAMGAEGVDAVDGESIIIANSAYEFIEKIKNTSVETTNAVANNAKNFLLTNYNAENIANSVLRFYDGLLSS
ncbi:MAG: glycosyltransferase family 4 protein [Ignavibacteria bacterium]|jgi:glycosyltransferase involved in cell wall biosynthesis|nr:glycosyltransferase family 4 protein [Ignavibacteria bacterium]